MADLELSLTDGTTTVVLASGSATLLSYTPRTPSDTHDPNGTVVESARILFGSVASARAALGNVNRLLTQARHYQRTRLGPRIFVQFRPDTAETLYRSELYSREQGDVGRVELEDDGLGMQWAGDKLALLVTWERRFYWEGAETALPLTNGNGTNVTTGLTCHNHDDGDSGHDNWVQIGAASVTGDLPAPLKLEIENSYNSATRAYEFYLAHNIWSSPTTFVPTLEGEASTAGGTVTPNGDQSGGNYMARSWTGTGETQAFSWALSPSLLSACAGNYFRILVRFANAPSTSPAMWVRLKVVMAGLTTIWQGQWVRLDNHLVQALDTAPLPPYLPTSGSLAELTLVMEAKRADAGTNSLGLDYLLLAPLDGWRLLTPKGYGLTYGDKLVDDQVEQRLYGVWSTGEVGYWVASGQTFALWPGKDQRLYFMHGDWVAGGVAQRTISVRAWYRPRRVTL